MLSNKKTVVFIQGFGNKDLFNGVVPRDLWGWRRNVGLLVHLLNRRGIPWQERYAANLREVHEEAGLFILRDWRFPQEDIRQFCQEHTGTPVVAMLFQCPQAFLDAQRKGDEQAVLKIDHPTSSLEWKGTEDGLFMADKVIVRSGLNAELFTRLGYSRDKMVLLPHAPLWDVQDNEVVPLAIPTTETPQRDAECLDLVFIGESIWRKGLVHLYRAFQTLPVKQKRLHLYNRTLLQCARGELDPPASYKDLIQCLLGDANIIVHAPYRSVEGMVEAYGSRPLLVCPSLLDCGPNVLVEAYQIGARAIASDLCGTVADLPEAWAEIVPAPHYWEQFEPFGEYAGRLSERILAAAGYDLTLNPAPPAKIYEVLQMIIATWEDLLQRYGIT